MKREWFANSLHIIICFLGFFVRVLALRQQPVDKNQNKVKRGRCEWQNYESTVSIAIGMDRQKFSPAPAPASIAWISGIARSLEPQFSDIWTCPVLPLGFLPVNHDLNVRCKISVCRSTWCVKRAFINIKLLFHKCDSK